MPEGMVSSQGDFPAIFRADAGLLDGHLAAHKHGMALFFTPPIPRQLLVVQPLGAGYLLHFVVDHRLHHQQPGLTGHLLDGIGHLRQQGIHRQDHLKGRPPRPHLYFGYLLIQFLQFPSGTIRLFLIRFSHHVDPF